MIGLHSCMVYSDPNAAGWGQPILTNAFFDTGMAGWNANVFEIPWAWSSGNVGFTSDNEKAGSEITRPDASTIARPANVDTYRIRVSATVTIPAIVWVYLRFGTTRAGASRGPFWLPAESVERWNAALVQPGTSTLEFVFPQNNPPGAQYVWLGAASKISPQDGNLITPWSGSLSSIELHYRSTGTSADISCLIDQIAIKHGRDDSTGQPEASTATIDLTSTPDAPLPAMVDIGGVVVVTTTTEQGSYTRFTGRITDIGLGWDEAGEQTPDAGIGQIVAVSLLGDLARRVIGDEPWPVELDGARVSRAADAAGYPLDPVWSDPGTVQILARDVDSKPALEVMQDAAISAGGVLWQTRNAELRYADADHRRGIAVGLELNSCDILVTPQWVRNLSGMINEVSIGYGVAPEGGEQARYTAENAASITKHGRFAYSFTSELADVAAATAMGNLLLTRNAWPVWLLSVLPVDMEGLSLDQTNRLLGLDMHALIRLTGMPKIGASPGVALVWVEGWAERLAHGEHEILLAVSDFCRTAPPPRWNDVAPDVTWDSLSASVTWDSAACLGPPVSLGRWDDQPATTRWDQISASVTWDTFV